MDCYIVRIYRRDEKDAQNIIGLVETVGVDEKQPFKGTDELITILGDMNVRNKKRKKNNSDGN